MPTSLGPAVSIAEPVAVDPVVVEPAVVESGLVEPAGVFRNLGNFFFIFRKLGTPCSDHSI